MLKAIVKLILRETPPSHSLRLHRFAPAMYYHLNVGVSTAKPNTHVLRILGPERLGFFEQGTPLDDVVRIIAGLALNAGVSTTELDNLVWLFGAKGYGAICASEPACGVCMLSARSRLPIARST